MINYKKDELNALKNLSQCYKEIAEAIDGAIHSIEVENDEEKFSMYFGKMILKTIELEELTKKI